MWNNKKLDQIQISAKRSAGSAMLRLDLIPAVPEPDGVLYPSDFNNGTQAPSIAMGASFWLPWAWVIGKSFVDASCSVLQREDNMDEFASSSHDWQCELNTALHFEMSSMQLTGMTRHLGVRRFCLFYLESCRSFQRDRWWLQCPGMTFPTDIQELP